METMIAACQNGHRIRASVKLAGSSHPCPRCGGKVQFPRVAKNAPMSHKQNAPASAGDPLSDTSVLRILGDLDPRSTASARDEMDQAEVADIPCPRCKTPIRANSQACEHCHCYVGAMPEFMGRLISTLGLQEHKPAV